MNSEATEASTGREVREQCIQDIEWLMHLVYSYPFCRIDLSKSPDHQLYWENVCDYPSGQMKKEHEEEILAMSDEELEAFYMKRARFANFIRDIITGKCVNRPVDLRDFFFIASESEVLPV